MPMQREQFPGCKKFSRFHSFVELESRSWQTDSGQQSKPATTCELNGTLPASSVPTQPNCSPNIASWRERPAMSRLRVAMPRRWIAFHPRIGSLLTTNFHIWRTRRWKIGRASCRERVWKVMFDRSYKKKTNEDNLSQ